MINENIVEINYLDKLKYLIINNIKNNQDKFAIDNLLADLKEKNNQSEKFEFKKKSLIFSITVYENSLSKIKSCYPWDFINI